MVANNNLVFVLSYECISASGCHNNWMIVTLVRMDCSVMVKFLLLIVSIVAHCIASLLRCKRLSHSDFRVGRLRDHHRPLLKLRLLNRLLLRLLSLHSRLLSGLQRLTNGLLRRFGLVRK